jgi:hypothetical protein
MPLPRRLPVPAHLRNLSGPYDYPPTPEKAAEYNRSLLSGLYEHAEKHGKPVTPKVPSAINYAPAYRIDEPMTFMSQTTSGPVAISRTTPAEYTMQMNETQRAIEILDNFRKRNADGGGGFFNVSPLGMDDHLNRNIYVIRGARGSIDMPDAYGMADPTMEYAAWNSGNDVLAHGADRHEIDHLLSEHSPDRKPAYRASPWFSPSDAQEAWPEVERLTSSKPLRADPGDGFRRFSISPESDFNASEARKVAGRIMESSGAGHSELQAILTTLKRDGQQIYGIPRTEREELSLLRKLLDGPLDFHSRRPVYWNGPRKGQPAHYFNEQRNGLKLFDRTLPDPDRQREMLKEMFLRALSDNSGPSESQYA